MVELIGADGIVLVHEVSAGSSMITVSPKTVRQRTLHVGAGTELWSATMSPRAKDPPAVSPCSISNPKFAEVSSRSWIC